MNYWMHNNMLTFGNQKMSKSLGNVRSGRSFIEEYNGEILKYMMLAVHYRSTTDFTIDAVENAIGQLARFYSALCLAEKLIKEPLALVPVPEKFQTAIDAANKGIEEALNDDFNTPEVVARFFEVMRLFNNMCRTPGKAKPEQKAIAEVYFHWLRDKGQVMALFQEPPSEFLRQLDDMLLRKSGVSRSEVDQIVGERMRARTEKNFALADELRAKLTSMGIAVLDSALGTEWEVHK